MGLWTVLHAGVDRRRTGPDGLWWTVAIIFECDMTFKLFFVLFFAAAAWIQPLIVCAAFRVLVLPTSPARSNCQSAIAWEGIWPSSWILWSRLNFTAWAALLLCWTRTKSGWGLRRSRRHRLAPNEFVFNSPPLSLEWVPWKCQAAVKNSLTTDSFSSPSCQRSLIR